MTEKSLEQVLKRRVPRFPFNCYKYMYIANLFLKFIEKEPLPKTTCLKRISYLTRRHFLSQSSKTEYFVEITFNALVKEGIIIYRPRKPLVTKEQLIESLKG